MAAMKSIAERVVVVLALMVLAIGSTACGRPHPVTAANSHCGDGGTPEVQMRVTQGSRADGKTIVTVTLSASSHNGSAVWFSRRLAPDPIRLDLRVRAWDADGELLRGCSVDPPVVVESSERMQRGSASAAPGTGEPAPGSQRAAGLRTSCREPESLPWRAEDYARLLPGSSWSVDLELLCYALSGQSPAELELIYDDQAKDVPSCYQGEPVLRERLDSGRVRLIP